jgi:hypothetical protein
MDSTTRATNGEGMCVLADQLTSARLFLLTASLASTNSCYYYFHLLFLMYVITLCCY